MLAALAWPKLVLFAQRVAFVTACNLFARASATPPRRQEDYMLGWSSCLGMRPASRRRASGYVATQMFRRHRPLPFTTVLHATPVCPRGKYVFTAD